MKLRIRKPRLDDKGTAIVESVIMLPFFILIFASAMYMMRIYSTKLERNTVARRCAWNYALRNYCEGSLPAECGTAQPETLTMFDAGDATAQQQVQNATSSGDSPVSSWVRDRLGDLLGATKRVTVSREIDRVGVYRAQGDHATVASNFSMVCNARPKSIYDLAHDLAHSLKNWATGH